MNGAGESCNLGKKDRKREREVTVPEGKANVMYQNNPEI
jgi:hypothetical protein